MIAEQREPEIAYAFYNLLSKAFSQTVFFPPLQIAAFATSEPERALANRLTTKTSRQSRPPPKLADVGALLAGTEPAWEGLVEDKGRRGQPRARLPPGDEPRRVEATEAQGRGLGGRLHQGCVASELSQPGRGASAAE
eukprot:503242-Rhodomonas_salina.2